MGTVEASIITKTVDIKDTRTISSATTGMVVKISKWTQPLPRAVAQASSIRTSSKTSNTSQGKTEITTKATTKTRKAKVRGPPCLKDPIKRHSTARGAALVRSKIRKDSDHSIATTKLDSSIPIKRGNTITTETKISRISRLSNKTIKLQSTRLQFFQQLISQVWQTTLLKTRTKCQPCLSQCQCQIYKPNSSKCQ